MTESLISFFAKRHLLTNLIFVLVLIGGVFAWNNTRKEEMPSVTFDRVRVSVNYPGAPSGDVEYHVTRPIEEELRSIEGIYRITSTSSVGKASINVELEQGLPNMEEAITEIKNAVLDVRLPDDVIDDPRVRVFKTTRKAILDIALIDKDVHLLDVPARRRLQSYAFALENQLLNLPEVDSINRHGYLQEEIQIKIYPERLARFEIPFNTVMKDIKSNQIRQPAGTLEAQREPKVTLLSELNSPEVLEDFIIQGGFEGKVIRLGEVSDIQSGYAKTEEINKVNGHEAVILNVVKSSSYGIIEAIDASKEAARRFRKNNLEDTGIELSLLDDESIDVRNRLSLISLNGAIGFILILLMLFLFLDKRSGVWVALGIPFTLCLTMIGVWLMGYSVNGTTLAAVIIVLGIVVDDAIVVAENISRLSYQGVPRFKAVVQGAGFVLLPIVASIVTTCVAFVPLFFFSGHFGKFVAFIPPVIFLMLGASLFESLFILPGHMHLEVPGQRVSGAEKAQRHWFGAVEEKYGGFLLRVILPHKWKVLSVFAALLVLSAALAAGHMKFVMFPNEETRDLVLTGQTPPKSTRYETAELVRRIEDEILPDVGGDVVGFRTQIARSRRGGAVEENRFRMIIEIVPKEKRKRSADRIIEDLKKKIDALEGFDEIKFRKSRWGHESGSPIELLVQQNDDLVRDSIVRDLADRMNAHPDLHNAEIDEGLLVPEYRIRINREKIKRLAISPQDIASTFRAALEGSVLFEFSNGDENVRVRLTTVDEAKDDIEKVLMIPVENRNNYLVPLKDIVSVEEVEAPNSIARRDLKRTTLIDADIRKGSKMTPLEIARQMEEEVFPEILSKHPTTTLIFGGEVQDTRESRQDLRNAVIMAVLLIYFVLVILFGSLLKPVIIMLVIPFGIVGVVLAFLLHGKTLFGFYAAVGVLGLAGVVINDSIIMLVKLYRDFDAERPRSETDRQISGVALTRLRAVVLTTLTTVVGVMPTAYGLAGYDAMLAEMMLALVWGLLFGTMITLILIPCIFRISCDLKTFFDGRKRTADA